MDKQPFLIKDCNLSLIATGIVAESLIELRDLLRIIPSGSLYYHFWCERLQVSFVHPEYHNDFAKWADFGLHDDILKEKLAVIDPTDYNTIEELRKKVVDVIEERLDEVEYFLWSRKEKKFHFLRSIVIVFDTGLSAQAPPDLKGILPKLTPNTIFYHFIDARRRTENGWDDFSLWLRSFNGQYEELIKKIHMIDPYFLSLTEIKQKLIQLFNESL